MTTPGRAETAEDFGTPLPPPTEEDPLREAPAVVFPPPQDADPEGIVAAGGDLSLHTLLSAYRQGIFPWFNDDRLLMWWSPDPRFVLYPPVLHVPRRLLRTERTSGLAVTVDHDFAGVIRACARAPRPGQEGTWITPGMEQAYIKLHRRGFAHSVEAWDGPRLVGGYYGVHLGQVFFGESMFALEPDASKIAFVRGTRAMQRAGIRLIDCQMETEHLRRFAARNVPRDSFLRSLASSLLPVTRDTWIAVIRALAIDPDSKTGNERSANPTLPGSVQ